MSIFKKELNDYSSGQFHTDIDLLDALFTNVELDKETKILSEQDEKILDDTLKVLNTEKSIVEVRDYYQEAIRKDKETYIKLFGTEEEKEELRLEQEKEIEEAKIQKEAEDKLKELTKEKEIQRKVAEIIKLKEEEEVRLESEFNRIVKGYEDMLTKIDSEYTLLKGVPVYFWDYLDNLVLEKLDNYYSVNRKDISRAVNRLTIDDNDYTISDESKLYEKAVLLFNDFIKQTETLKIKLAPFDDRQYSYGTSIKLDKALHGMLDYLFDYMKNHIVKDTLSCSIEMEPFDDTVNYRYRIYINKKILANEKELTTLINFNGYNLPEYGVTFYEKSYKTENLLKSFELLFVESVSKQWLDFNTLSDNSKSKGIKTKFLEQTDIYRVKENLENWKI